MMIKRKKKETEAVQIYICEDKKVFDQKLKELKKLN